MSSIILMVRGCLPLALEAKKIYTYLMALNALTKAQVVSVDPDNYAVYVYLTQQAGEGPVMPVRVLCPGPCDGLRISQPALPGRGTLGVVAALDDDSRALVWLGSLPLNAQDAISVIPGQNNIEYISHFSGFYSLLDEIGNLTQVWPDGTSIVVGPTSGQPTRHIVNSSGIRESVPVLPADRVSVTPSPFPFTYLHPTGTRVNVDTNGNVNVIGAASISVSGSTLINIYSPNTINMNTGNLNITGSINLVGSFNAIASGGGPTTFNVSGTIKATEDIVASTSSSSISLTNHLTSEVQSGGANSGPPVPNT